MRYEILDRLPVVSTGGRHVYIWGTGNTSICYQEGFARENWLEIYGYGVNDENQHGGGIPGKTDILSRGNCRGQRCAGADLHASAMGV